MLGSIDLILEDCVRWPNSLLIQNVERVARSTSRTWPAEKQIRHRKGGKVFSFSYPFGNFGVKVQDHIHAFEDAYDEDFHRKKASLFLNVLNWDVVKPPRSEPRSIYLESHGTIPGDPSCTRKRGEIIGCSRRSNTNRPGDAHGPFRALSGINEPQNEKTHTHGTNVPIKRLFKYFQGCADLFCPIIMRNTGLRNSSLECHFKAHFVESYGSVDERLILECFSKA